MTVLALAVLVALVGPHLLPKSALSPGAGIALWVEVLALRAMLTVFAALLVVFYIPTTQLFQLVTQWCFHAVLPFLTTHLGFSGHQLGDVAVVVPALFLALSAISALAAIWRGARHLRRWLGTDKVGEGPDQSVIVGGAEVMVAAAGFRDPRIVVSAGALCSLDDAELNASLEHERGHIRRHHRFVLLAAHVFTALARLLPGSRLALKELQLQLERDADQYAVKRTGEPLALAGAICKAALKGGPVMRAPAALTSLAGEGTTTRLRLLLGEVHIKRGARLLARATLALSTVIVLVILAATPALASVGVDQLNRPVPKHLCDD